MVIRSRVHLAQVVCAVYSLSRPQGVSRAEIAKFCRKRFGAVCTGPAWNRLLERAVDERLLARFRRRYRLAKGSSCILWAVEEGGRVRTQRTQGKKRSRCRGRCKNKTMRNRPCKTLCDRPKRVNNKIKINLKNKNSIKNWGRNKRSLQPQMSHKNIVKKRLSRKNILRDVTYQNKRSCLKNVQEVNRLIGANECKRNTKRKKFKPPKKRNRLSLHSATSNACFDYIESKRGVRNSVRSKAKSDSYRFTQTCKKYNDPRLEVYRARMRLSKTAAVHAKSWDSINNARKKHQKENEDLMKGCRVIQKILTKAHSASWDSLNHKLRKIKAAWSGPMMSSEIVPISRIGRSFNSLKKC